MQAILRIFFKISVHAVYWAGSIVNLLIYFDYDEIEHHSCPVTVKSFWQDRAKKVYLLVIGLRFLLIPFELLVHRCLQLDFPNQHYYRIERGLVVSIAGQGFLMLAVMRRQLMSAFDLLLLPVTLWPVICEFIKWILPRFKRVSVKEYNNIIQNRKMAYAAAGFELSHSMFSLATTVDVLIHLMFNLFYDTTHDDTSSLEKPVTDVGVIISALISVVLGLNRKSWIFSRAITVAMVAFYNTFMMASSMLFCKEPQDFDKNFYQRGFVFVVLFALFSLSYALLAGRLAARSISAADYSHENDLTCCWPASLTSFWRTIKSKCHRVARYGSREVCCGSQSERINLL